MFSGSASDLHKNLWAKPAVKPRQTATQKRREIALAQVAALQKCVADIKCKSRETPGWANGYNSAITTIELEITEISKGLK